MSSILDLPEPLRSQALALRGMTAKEFAAHMAGIDATLREQEEMIQRGELERATDLHYGDDLPGVRVVSDWVAP